MVIPNFRGVASFSGIIALGLSHEAQGTISNLCPELQKYRLKILKYNFKSCPRRSVFSTAEAIRPIFADII